MKGTFLIDCIKGRRYFEKAFVCLKVNSVITITTSLEALSWLNEIDSGTRYK